jgi:hypothetical protein
MPKGVKHRVGSSQVNASDLKGLQIAWRQGRLVPFLGAGLSLEYGLPSWKNLVLEMLFEQTDRARRMAGFWPQYRRALAAWVVDYFEYDPVVLAQVVKNEISKSPKNKADARQVFLEAVRRFLYPQDRPTPAGKRATTLAAVADLIAKGAKKKHIPAVVTFNFDDLLERELADRGVSCRSISDGRRIAEGGLPIIHPHGFLPREGDLTDCRLVFTEEEYHRLTGQVFHWALSEIVSHLRHNTVLFIGLSMSDPNLRRLLAASYEYGDIPAHWQVRKRHEVRDHEQAKVLQDIDSRAADYATDTPGTAGQKGPAQLIEAVNAVLQQADTYDSRLFQLMGVKTIWLDSFADIPHLLKKITE